MRTKQNNPQYKDSRLHGNDIFYAPKWPLLGGFTFHGFFIVILSFIILSSPFIFHACNCNSSDDNTTGEEVEVGFDITAKLPLENIVTRSDVITRSDIVTRSDVLIAYGDEIIGDPNSITAAGISYILIPRPTNPPASFYDAPKLYLAAYIEGEATLENATIYGNEFRYGINLPEGNYAFGVVGELEGSFLKTASITTVPITYFGKYHVNRPFVMLIRDLGDMDSILGGIEFSDPLTGEPITLESIGLNVDEDTDGNNVVDWFEVAQVVDEPPSEGESEGEVLSGEKEITTFSFVSPVVNGSINEETKAILVAVPNGTTVTALIAEFTITGVSINIGSEPQISGETANDFTNPVVYTVVAQDGSIVDYTVTVEIAPLEISRFTKLTASDGVNGDLFGTSVSLSTDTNMILIGAMWTDNGGEKAGSAYLYRWYDLLGWREYDKFDGSTASSNLGPVAIADTSSGDISYYRFLLGAPGYSNSKGNVDYYRYTLSSYAGSSTYESLNNSAGDGDLFGNSVAIAAISMEETVAVVGAPFDDTNALNAGEVFIYKITYGVVGMPQVLDVFGGEGVNDYIGTSVSISGDGNIIIASAPGDNNGQGTVYTYTSNGESWDFSQKLTASDSADNDDFGEKVAVSSDGNTLVVGASKENDFMGAAYIFKLNNGTWGEVQKLVAYDGEGGGLTDGDRFGTSAAISENGNIIAVTSPYDDDNGSASGSVYIYKFDGESWNFSEKITADDGLAGDLLGFSISLSLDGTILIAGAPGPYIGESQTPGAVYVIEVH